MEDREGEVGVMPICVMLLPNQTGIFTSPEYISKLITGEKGEIQWADDLKQAFRLVRDRYTVDELFLMGIDSTNDMYKNRVYSNF